MRSGNSWQERSGELEGRLRQRAWVVLDLSALGEPQMMTSGEHGASSRNTVQTSKAGAHTSSLVLGRAGDIACS